MFLKSHTLSHTLYIPSKNKNTAYTTSLQLLPSASGITRLGLGLGAGLGVGLGVGVGVGSAI